MFRIYRLTKEKHVIEKIRNTNRGLFSVYFFHLLRVFQPTMTVINTKFTLSELNEAGQKRE